MNTAHPELLRELHRAGYNLHNERWPLVGPQLVGRFTDGRTSNSKLMTDEEAHDLLSNLRSLQEMVSLSQDSTQTQAKTKRYGERLQANIDEYNRKAKEKLEAAGLCACPSCVRYGANTCSGPTLDTSSRRREQESFDRVLVYNETRNRETATAT